MRLAAAFVVVAVVLSALGHAQASPQVAYPSFIPAGGNFDACYATAPPLVNDPSNVFAVMHCVNTGSGAHASKVSHIDFTRRNSGVKWIINVPGVIFRSQPIAVTSTQVLAFTYDSATSMVGLLDTTLPSPKWTMDRHNATSGIAYDSQNQIAFMPMGSHGSLGFTEMVAVYALNGSIKWQQPFAANSVLGTPIFYEERILIMHDSTLKSFDANSGVNNPWVYTYPNPCGMVAMAGRKLNLALVQFGFDVNGPLKALLLYGMTSNGNYSVCHLHHSSYKFGQKEWMHQGPWNNTIDAVTGGGGHLFVSLLNEKFNTYHVAVLNATAKGDQEALKLFLNRSSIDRHSYPAVLLDPATGGLPIMVLQMQGKLTAYRLYGDYGVAWVHFNVACAQQPAVWTGGTVSRAVCLGFVDGVVAEVDYSGVLVWSYLGNSVSFYPAQIYFETNVFVQGQLSVTGYSFDAAVTTYTPSPSDEDGGTSAGVVVLIIFVIIFVVVLGAAIWKAVRVRSARTVVRESTDKEGYAGLNA